MRTLWVCDIAGGPNGYAATKPGSADLGLEEAHRALEISPAIFDELGAELGRSLPHFNVPETSGMVDCANIGAVAALADAVTAFNPTERIRGKTIIRVRS